MEPIKLGPSPIDTPAYGRECGTEVPRRLKPALLANLLIVTRATVLPSQLKVFQIFLATHFRYHLRLMAKKTAHALIPVEVITGRFSSFAVIG